MAFFSKLFRKADDKLCPNQRAPLENAKHFDAMVIKLNKVMQLTRSTNEELMAAGKQTPYNYWALAIDHLRKVYLTYSMGKPIEESYDLFMKAAELYEQSWDPAAAYADILQMVSLGYLLQVPDKEYEYTVQYVIKTDQGSIESRWKPDGLLWFIINARKPGGPQPRSVVWPKLYQELFEITQMPKSAAETAMKLHLDKWYSLHSQDPWYDNHKKKLCYIGYWAWEAGAVTKIMQLDDSSFRDHPHYPYDLVHWTKR